MLGFAAGRGVKIRVIAQDAGRLHRVGEVLLRELLQSVVGGLVDEVALLDPAFEASGGAHAGEAFFVLKNLHSLSVFHGTDAVEDCRYLIAE